MKKWIACCLSALLLCLAYPALAETMSQTAALRKAESYLAFTSFSRTGLIVQLEYDGVTHEDALYAADLCGADWNAQAAAKAQSFLTLMSFSTDGLIQQLEYDGFTHEEAVYGASQCADTATDAGQQAQALRKAEGYLGLLSFSFSYTGLTEQLEYDGFTHEQAVYAADHCGADWNAQAAAKAQIYMSVMTFDREQLIDQLEFDGFTHEEALYGAAAAGY